MDENQIRQYLEEAVQQGANADDIRALHSRLTQQSAPEVMQPKEDNSLGGLLKNLAGNTAVRAFDIGNAARTGLAQGVTGLATGLVDLGSMAGSYAANKALGTDYSAPSMTNIVNRTLGINYQPATTAGKYTQTIANQVPGLAAIGVRSPSQMAKLAGGAGIGSEMAGQATDGTDVEPFARIAGSIVGGGIASRFAKPTEYVPNADQLRKTGGVLYKSAEETGGLLKPEFTNKFVDEIEGMKPQTTIGKRINKADEFSALQERISTIRNEPMSLDAAQELDEHLSDVIDSFVDKTTGKLNKQGAKVFDIQSRLRNSIENASEEDALGSIEGFKALKKARDTWAASRRLADVERIINRASGADNEAQAIKSGFKALRDNPNRIKSFKPDEQALIKKVADSNAAVDVLRQFGSRLIGIITAASGGGLGGTAAATGASMASRNLATRLKISQADKLASSIAKKGAKSAGIPTVMNGPRLPSYENRILGSLLGSLPSEEEARRRMQ